MTAFLPVSAPVLVPPDLLAGGVRIDELPACNVASSSIGGRIWGLEGCYRRLGTWVAFHAVPSGLPVRELYLTSVARVRRRGGGHRTAMAGRGGGCPMSGQRSVPPASARSTSIGWRPGSGRWLGGRPVEGQHSSSLPARSTNHNLWQDDVVVPLEDRYRCITVDLPLGAHPWPLFGGSGPVGHRRWLGCCSTASSFSTSKTPRWSPTTRRADCFCLPSPVIIRRWRGVRSARPHEL